MNRLQKRLTQLNAKLRYMAANKASKSVLYKIVKDILVIESAIEALQKPKSDLEIANEIAYQYGGNVWQNYGLTRIYFQMKGFRKKFYIEVKNGNLDLNNAPVRVFQAISNAA